MIHKMHAFVPSVVVMGKVEGNNKTKETIHKYRNDLPIPGNTFNEDSWWERQWKAFWKENQSDSLAKALKICNMDLYPNMHVLLNILETVAVTSCNCERSRSVLKRLNTYLPVSMG